MILKNTTQRAPIIGVMGSGQKEWNERTYPLGKWVAENGYNLLTGGGNGVMRSVSEAFVQVQPRDGKCIGVLPGEFKNGQLQLREGYPNPFVEIPIYTHLPMVGMDGQNVRSRNHINILSSDLVVVLPGGLGTVSEIVLAMEYQKPLILFIEHVKELPPLTVAVPQTADILNIIEFIKEKAPVRSRVRQRLRASVKGNPMRKWHISDSVITLYEGDITEHDTDAIVNAANDKLILGAGVAGAIRNKGGAQIQEECNQYNGAEVGTAVITSGGNLKAKFVIHAVGPRMGEGDEERKLASATLNALQVAAENNLTSITFPAISSGIFGFPIGKCAQIMLSVAAGFLKRNRQLIEIRFCLWGEVAYSVFESVMAELENKK